MRRVLLWRRPTGTPGGTLRTTYLRLGVVVALAALAAHGAVTLLLQGQREPLADRRLSDLAVPLAVQFRELLQTGGLSPDQALDRLRPQATALGLAIGMLGPDGRVLRDSSGGFLEGIDTGVSAALLPANLEAPHRGRLQGHGGIHYR